MTTGGLLGLRPALRPGILLGPALTRGPAVVHLVKDPVTGVRMEVGAKEHFIIARLDGSRSLAEIGTEYAAHFGTRLGDAQWGQMLRLLGARQLLSGPQASVVRPGPGAAPAAPGPGTAGAAAGRSGSGSAAGAARSPGGRRKGGLFGGRTRMVADAPALMDRLHAATGFARSRAVLVPLLALALAVPVAVAVRLGELMHQTHQLYDQPVALAAVGCVLWVSLGLHEIAHGLVARAYGLRVGEIGLRRVWGVMTYLYCEVEDVQFLDRRGRQIAVAAAGAVANLLFLVPFWPVWALLPDRAQALPFFGGLLLLGTAMALLNLVPLPPLDGYKALGYALGTLRLATESRTFLTLSARALRRPQATGTAPAAVPRGAANAPGAPGASGAVGAVGAAEPAPGGQAAPGAPGARGASAVARTPVAGRSGAPGARRTPVASAAGARARLGSYPVRLRVLYTGYGLCCAVLAIAVLAGAGLLCRAALPDSLRAWTGFLPVAVIAAAGLLRLLGLRFAARRAATRPVPDVPAADVSAPASGAPVADVSAPASGAPVADVSAPASGAPAADVSPPDGDPHTHAPAPQSGTPSRQREKREKGHMTPQPRPAGTAIVLDGVSKHYGQVRALDDVSLTVAQGEFFGVLGPNGAGKTTLVEIVEGMRRADSGTVTVFGLSPWPRNTALLRRIGVQTQTSAFFTRLTAWEHLETVAALHGADRAAARHALDLVGLNGKRRSRVDDLSGGQRQRLALATALVHQPDLIFLDEPTAALDPEARRSLWAVLRELRGEGRTIVYTTHYLDEAEALCDRVAIVAGGRVVALDSPGALIRSMAAPARLLVPADRITVEQARQVEGAERVLVEGGEIVIETRHANRALVALAALVDMDAIQTRTATLEDAYLRLTAGQAPDAVSATAGSAGTTAPGIAGTGTTTGADPGSATGTPGPDPGGPDAATAPDEPAAHPAAAGTEHGR